MSHRPARLLLQWHLSDRCNLRCGHCYQNDYRASGEAGWRRVLSEFRRFLAGDGQRIPGHLNVTGGEPLALPGFAKLIEEFAQLHGEFSFAILSNGTLVDADWVTRLQAARPSYFQISLDGLEESHDQIRGAGSFAAAVAGIRALVAGGIPVVLAFTAHRDNFREFPSVAKLGRALGVTRVWSDRLIPEGSGSALQGMSADETREWVAQMSQVRGEEATVPRPLRFFRSERRTEVAMHRALQFLGGGEQAYRCTAGETLLTVMPDGTVYPCRRLPIPVGNLFEQPLAEIWQAATLQQLRDPAASYAGCEHCVYAPVCRGGLRCLAYAQTGELRRGDPGCWLMPALAAAASTTTTAPAAAAV